MSSKSLYDENSIESLNPLEFTRLRPGVYVGSTAYSTQLLYEIVANSIDEVKLGHGSRIEVSITKENFFRVRDYGQGFIYSMDRDDGKSILEAAFSVLNTSGKYRSDGVYEGTALGLNGIGSKLPNFLSHWCDVISFRDGYMEYIKFEEGVFKSRDYRPSNAPTGTIVEWCPSEEFFENTGVDEKAVKKFFHDLVCLCPGLTIEFDNKGEKITYYAPNGLNDLINNATEGKEIIKNKFSFNHEEGKNKINFILTYTSNYSFSMIPYVNMGLTESGPHIVQIKTLLTREFNKFFREKGWLKEKEENLSGEDIQEGMFIVTSIIAPDISYDAQTKSRIVKIDMKPFTQAIAEELQYWMAANEKDIKQIADKALNARKAREAARKARDAARGVKDKNSKKQLLNLPTKLVDSWSKKRLDCELYIVEGDSAANGLVKARDSEKQAIFPIRGKMISSYKNSSDKVFQNQEIINLIKAIGLEFNPITKKLIYDTKKLRYGKIIAAADADPDGKSIKNLIFTNLWSLCPELIINGHVYAAVPPLYRITTRKNEYIYLNDNIALAEYKRQHVNDKFLISRNKGLGEQDSEELEVSLLNYHTRAIQQIIVPNQEEAEKMFDILMGNSVPPRREYLLAHSEEAEDL